MAQIIVFGVGMGIIFINFAICYLLLSPKVYKKIRRTLDITGVMITANIFIFIAVIVSTIGLGIASEVTFEPKVNWRDCKQVEIPMVFKDVYYFPEDQKLYVAYTNFDTLSPEKDLREPDEEERAKIVKYVEENYDRWAELYQATTKLNEAS